MSQTKFNFPAVYNPANQTKEELIANFVVRLKEFQSIFGTIKKDPMKKPPQHFIIQGTRGSGKTTLLLRLFHAVTDDEKLQGFLIPVIFDEEQYTIRTLSKFWEEIALNLEDEHELLFQGLHDDMQNYLEEEDYEEICYNLLEKRLQEKNKKLVLLIDNFGKMLSKFRRKERQRLREVLIQCSDIRIVGGSAVVLEHFYDYSEPFFEFFKIFHLEGLNQKETKELLMQLSKTYKTAVVKDIIENNPGRIETLRRLTSGVPRTIILLFEIFLDNEKGDAFKDLEIILDRVSPLYIQRMDELPPQKQDIVNAIAMNWDAVGVKEIAKKTRIPGKSVSAQLNELEKNNIIVKIPTSTKNNLYQLAERFFNIWYLMRHGRKRERNKVLWLVRFLESWCNEEELISRTMKHILALQTGDVFEKHAYYMTEALADTNIPEDMQDKLLKETKEYLIKKNSPFVREVSSSDKELSEEAVSHVKNEEYTLALKKVLRIRKKNHQTLSKIAVLYFAMKKNKAEALDYAKKAVELGKNLYSTLVYSIILLWNNEIEEAIETFQAFMGLVMDKESEDVAKVLRWIIPLLLAKKQYHYLDKLFKENTLDIKTRLKPFYYALMFLMQDTYPDEYKKMGPELKETVEEIIKKVNKLAIDYR